MKLTYETGELEEEEEKPESTETMLTSVMNPHQSSLLSRDNNHPNITKIITVNMRSQS